MFSLLPTMRQCARISSYALTKNINSVQLCKNRSLLHSYTSTDDSVLKSAHLESPSFLSVEYANGLKYKIAHVWLRDNCQCPQCFDPVSLGRKILLKDFDTDVAAKQVKVNESGELQVEWGDGHRSTFESPWMYRRRYEKDPVNKFENFISLKKKLWSSDHILKRFVYSKMMEQREILLNFLISMETEGITMVTECPPNESAVKDLCNAISMVRRTHYGSTFPVKSRENANNLAYRSIELGLHTDLTYYDYQPGVQFFHALKQAKDGGDSIVSDGFYAANEVRKINPSAFKILSTLPAVFWDKGVEKVIEDGIDEFYKIEKTVQIKLDENNEFQRISFNNQVRDSFLNLPPEEVKPFYEAMKLFNTELYKSALYFKVNAGEMFVVDNLRCLHGRVGFESTESRHLEGCYMDWDEMRCCRRRLQEKFNKWDDL